MSYVGGPSGARGWENLKHNAGFKCARVMPGSLAKL
jgi:hypothetical protein